MSAPARSGLKVAGGVLAVLGVLIGIWAGTRVHSNRPAAADEAPLQVPAGVASPPTARDADADLRAAPGRIPDHLPAFTLGDRQGRATPIGTWSGKSLVLNFWATWCAPCRREIPLLKSLSARWQDRGVQVVGVAVDHRDKVAAYADELKIPYPILVGEQDALDVAAEFGVDTPVFPFTVFTDRRGQVVTLYVGELHQAQADLILAAVQRVNDDQVGLAEAQHSIVDGLHALTDGSG